MNTQLFSKRNILFIAIVSVLLAACGFIPQGTQVLSGSGTAGDLQASNGERIYFTSVNDAGDRISYSGGPKFGGMMMGIPAGDGGAAPEAVPVPEGAPAPEGEVEEKAVEAAPAAGGSVCDAYAACCNAYADALGKVEGIPAQSVEATKQGCEQIKNLKGMGDAAEQACQQALDAMKQAGEAYKSMPGFTWPDECK